MICLIVFTILFELGLAQLDTYMEQFPPYAVMLATIYKELMIMGFISFGLLLCIEFFTLPSDYLVTSAIPLALLSPRNLTPMI
jgi:hypothetical protein